MSEKPSESKSIYMLWPTPILRKKFPQHKKVNASLVQLFCEHREKDEKNQKAVYSSADDLLQRYDNAALNELFQFISGCVLEIANSVNGEQWQHSRSKKMNMSVVGAWFQIQNKLGFHEPHTHGNCSWSGVYYVQIDEEKKRVAHPSLAEKNGLTRFYGPHFDLIGGGYMDSGNLYLQSTTFDSNPEEGVLVVFPSHLKHMAMPYEGEKDRIIVSFNVQVHGDQGDAMFDYNFH